MRPVTIVIQYRGNVDPRSTWAATEPKLKANYIRRATVGPPAANDYTYNQLVLDSVEKAKEGSQLELFLRRHDAEVVLAIGGALTVTVERPTVEEALMEHVEIAKDFPKLLEVVPETGPLTLTATDVRMPYSKTKEIVKTNYRRTCADIPPESHVVLSMLGLCQRP